jgi:hypothetical protein
MWFGIRRLRDICENSLLTGYGVTPFGETVRVLTVRCLSDFGCRLDWV